MKLFAFSSGYIDVYVVIRKVGRRYIQHEGIKENR